MNAINNTDKLLSDPMKNTDKELWREREGDYYADSIHVTENGAIGINCGGMVHVKPIREWHRLAKEGYANKHPETNLLGDKLKDQIARGLDAAIESTQNTFPPHQECEVMANCTNPAHQTKTSSPKI
jgi:hypothetical protein